MLISVFGQEDAQIIGFQLLNRNDNLKVGKIIRTFQQLRNSSIEHTWMKQVLTIVWKKKKY